MKKVVSITAGILLAAAALAFSVIAQEVGTRLGDAVVTATKTEKDLRDVMQSVMVVTREEIRQSGATDVATAVQNAASVVVAAAMRSATPRPAWVVASST